MDEHKATETIEEFYEKYEDAKMFSLSRFVLFPGAKHPLPSMLDVMDEKISEAQIEECYGGGDYIVRAMLEEGWTSDEDSFKLSVEGEPKPCAAADQCKADPDRRYQEELALFMQAAMNLAEAFAERSKSQDKEDPHMSSVHAYAPPRVRAIPRAAFNPPPSNDYSNRSFRLGMGVGSALSAMGLAALSEDIGSMLGEGLSRIIKSTGLRPPMPDQVFPIIAVPPADSRTSFYDKSEDNGEDEGIFKAASEDEEG